MTPDPELRMLRPGAIGMGSRKRGSARRGIAGESEVIFLAYHSLAVL